MSTTCTQNCAHANVVFSFVAELSQFEIFCNATSLYPSPRVLPAFTSRRFTEQFAVVPSAWEVNDDVFSSTLFVWGTGGRWFKSTRPDFFCSVFSSVSPGYPWATTFFWEVDGKFLGSESTFRASSTCFCLPSEAASDFT